MFSRKSKAPQLEGKSLEELLFLAETQADPVVRHAALTRAEMLAPDNLDIQRALLLLGRLHERSPRAMDFSVIKSYLLHAFEHPEEHPPQEVRQMARELFDDRRLLRCLELAPDREAFLRSYLEELSREYMRVFVAADNRHIPRVFGISFKGSLAKYLAAPAKDILSNILSSPYLDEEEARVLARAFYRAFFEHAGGETGELDSKLGAQLRALLR